MKPSKKPAWKDKVLYLRRKDLSKLPRWVYARKRNWLGPSCHVTSCPECGKYRNVRTRENRTAMTDQERNPQ